MPSTTVSTRINEEEALMIEALAEEEGCDRSTLIKTLLRSGILNLRLKQAITSYADGKITLSRAAKKAGLSIWDFLSLMPDKNLTLNYDLHEFEEDLKALDLKKAP